MRRRGIQSCCLFLSRFVQASTDAAGVQMVRAPMNSRSAPSSRFASKVFAVCTAAPCSSCVCVIVHVQARVYLAVSPRRCVRRAGLWRRAAVANLTSGRACSLARRQARRTSSCDMFWLPHTPHSHGTSATESSLLLPPVVNKRHARVTVSRERSCGNIVKSLETRIVSFDALPPPGLRVERRKRAWTALRRPQKTSDPPGYCFPHAAGYSTAPDGVTRCREACD
jgi:hypothetical protein